MKEKNFVSAVVYIKNAENEIENFVVNLNKVLNKHFLHYEIILVNDGSVDNSILKIKEKQLLHCCLTQDLDIYQQICLKKSRR